MGVLTVDTEAAFEHYRCSPEIEGVCFLDHHLVKVSQNDFSEDSGKTDVKLLQATRLLLW